MSKLERQLQNQGVEVWAIYQIHPNLTRSLVSRWANRHIAERTANSLNWHGSGTYRCVFEMPTEPVTNNHKEQEQNVAISSPSKSR